jgi:hypothetical protein
MKGTLYDVPPFNVLDDGNGGALAIAIGTSIPSERNA